MRLQEILFPDVQADRISRMTSDMLLSEETCYMILNARDAFSVKKLEGLCLVQAGKLKVKKEFAELLKAYKMKVAASRNINHGNKTEFTDQPIQLNCGEWVCDVSGVKKNEFDARSDTLKTKYASPIPVLVTEILENIEEGTEKIRIGYYKEGSWKSIICNRSTVASNTKIIELADRGLEVNSENAKMLVKYIADLTALNLDIIPRNKAVSTMGWHNEEFMPYSDLKFDGENEHKHLYESISESGNFEKWIDYTHNLRQNIYLRLQMAASFASPILSCVGALPFVLHLWGGTGNGKTVGMMVAMSIWGNPKSGKLVKTMNMTTNAMMTSAAFLNNIPFAGDELQTVKSYTGYDSLIMRICEGIGRDRMKYNVVEKTQTWRCSFLFTGEENCIRDNSGGGTANRVISIECVEKVVEDGNSVVNFITENYGFAGRIITDAIKEENLQEQYAEIFRNIIQNSDTTEKQAMAMSSILLGDALACKYIYKNETPLSLNDVKRFLLSKNEVDVSERAYEFVLNLIAVNEKKFSKESPGEIWGKFCEKSILINKSILIREMRNNDFEFDAVKNKWSEKGYLLKNSAGRFIHQTKCFGMKAAYIKFKLNDIEETADLSEPPF